MFKLNGRRLLSVSSAFIMAFTMVFGTMGISDVFADTTITRAEDNTTTISKPIYQTGADYVAENVNEGLIKQVEGKSVQKIKKNLEETKYSIRLKRLVAEKEKMPKDCSIDQMWKSYSDAFISQYTEVVPLYEASDDAEYYIANFAASKLNGLGDVYDSAFVRGTNNKKPDIRHDIKFDKKTGLAYIPKAYFDGKEGEKTLITGQVMHAGSVNHQTTKIDVEIENPNDDAQSKRMALEASTYDVTTSVPVTDSLKTAKGLSLDDLSVYLNGSETTYDLKGEEAAIYHEDTGTLELGISPSTLTSVKVKIRKKKLLEKLASVFTSNVNAKITNPDSLKFAKDKKTGDPILLDKIDPDKLQDGQVFEYNANIQYFSNIDDVTGDYSTKARKESIKHSIKYLYIPTGSAESGWFDVYDKGSDFDDTDGVNQKSDFEDVTFGMTLPSKNLSNYKATALNKNKATLNFHQKGSFVTTYDGDDASYSSKHMYAGECCHITNPMGTQSGDSAKIRLSVLHVNTDKNYVIVGLNTQETNTQSGFGIYKLAFESKGAVQIKKSSANTTITKGNNCYSLKGAEFGVYSDSACTKKVLTLTTKEDGTTDAKEIDAGKYYVKETKAPKGYKLNTKVTSVTVDTDDDEDNPAIVEIADTPGTDPATMEVKKVDKETGAPGQQGNASLAGAQFTVNYYNNYYSDISKLPSEPTRNWVLETKEKSIGGKKFTVIGFEDQYKVSGDEFYKKADGSVTIPFGTITITETKAPEGYKIEDSTVSVNGATLSDRTYFTKVEEGKDLGTIAANFTVSDPVKKYGIQVYKFDKELNKSEAIGGKDHQIAEDAATLEGVAFDIINRSTNKVKYNGKEFAPGETVMQLTTKWNKDLKTYTAQTGNKDLSFGTYGVKEVKSSQGYLLTDGKERTVVCNGEDGHLYTPKDQQDLTFKNQVIRGDFGFVKKSQKQTFISAAFKVTNVATKESHVIVTNKNGEYKSTKKHSTNTNANDKILEEYDGTTPLKSSDFDYSAGTWFGLGEDGTMAEVNDDLNAFPYGKYEVEELLCESNEGLKLVKFNFFVTDDGYSIDGGTVTDMEDQVPKIHTTAKDAATGNHFSAASDDVTIVDTVTYANLEKGKQYKLVGTLMDKATGNAVPDADGKAIVVEKQFKAPADGGEVEVDFDIDASALTGKTVVVFEELYEGENVIATHKDLEDEGQTISFPNIKTTAKDAETNSNISRADKEMTIIDTVAYSNLTPDKIYTISGTLMDKETGKPVVDDEGKEVTATAKFTAQKSSGTADVTFKFSGINTAGKTMVAFEELSFKGKTYAVHADINDEAQTIYVPKIATTATDKENGTHMSMADKEVTIVDSVAYSNLTVGKEYTVNGKLMDQSTGKDLIINGKPVTASKTFTVENADGTIELEFKFDGSSLAGSSVVVFEDVYQGDVKIASHADIKDEGQTIYLPKIGTTATSGGKHEVTANKQVTIVDKVDYTNLIPGKPYTLEGFITNKQTGKPVMVNGAQVTATKEFTPEKSSGSVEISFTFDASALGGKELVVFETVKSGEAIIAVHADVNDKNQTVNVLKPVQPVSRKAAGKTPESGTSVKTGQSSMIPMAVGFVVLVGCAAGIAVYLKKKKKL